MGMLKNVLIDAEDAVRQVIDIRKNSIVDGTVTELRYMTCSKAFLVKVQHWQLPCATHFIVNAGSKPAEITEEFYKSAPAMELTSILADIT